MCTWLEHMAIMPSINYGFPTEYSTRFGEGTIHNFLYYALSSSFHATWYTFIGELCSVALTIRI